MSTSPARLRHAREWYWRHFVAGFCHSWPLPLLFLLPVALVVGPLAALGPRHLVFHDEPLKGAVTAAALVFFQAEILFVAYMFGLRDVRQARTTPSPDEPRGFRRYAWRLLACLAVTVAAVVGLTEVAGALLNFIPVLAAPGATPDLADTVDNGAVVGVLAGAGLALTVLLGLGGRLHRAQAGLLRWAAGRLRPGPGESPPLRHRVAGWVGAGAVLGGWLVLTLLLVWSPQDAGQPLGAFVVGAVGLIPSALALVRRHDGRWLAAAGVVNLGLAYGLATYCLSYGDWGLLTGVAALAALTGCLGATVRGLLPEAWASLRLALADAWEALDDEEREHAGWWAACLALPVALLGVAVAPPLASPVPLMLSALAGGAALYGLAGCYLRRAAPVFVGLLVVAALLAHLQPYKMRFEALEPWYSSTGVLRLVEETEENARRQEQFDRALERFDQAETAAAAAREMRSLWFEMEERNRARAARLLPAQRADLRGERGGARVDPDVGVAQGRLGRSSDSGLLHTGELAVHEAARAGPNGDRPTLILVAVSGGGIRAAAWTFLVLSELEKAFAAEGIDFPAHTRLISGASGGMTGAAYYVATLPKPPRDPGVREHDLDAQYEMICRDSLTPLLRRAVLTDLPGWFSPWPLRHDRGAALERAWADHLKWPSDPEGRGALEVRFADLREGEREGWRPTLVFSPMLVEDGRRLIISNLDLRYAISNDGWVLSSNPETFRNNHSVDALELFRMYRGADRRLTLATAARMSASFPYFSPAVPLPTVPRRRVVDAGYYDNYGVSIASSWLFSGGTYAWLRQNFDRVLVVQIRAGSTEAERQLRRVRDPGSTTLARGLEEATSPIEGLFNGRFASSSFLNDGQLELLERFYVLRQEREQLMDGWRSFGSDERRLEERRRNLERARAANAKAAVPLPELDELARPVRHWLDARLMVVNFELDAPAATSWYLTTAERRRIWDKGRELQLKIARLMEWWYYRPEGAPKGGP